MGAWGLGSGVLFVKMGFGGGGLFERWLVFGGVGAYSIIYGIIKIMSTLGNI